MKCAWKELLSILPPVMKTDVDRLGRETLQEIRLRKNMTPVLVTSGGKTVLPQVTSQEDLQYVINMACRYSPWTAVTTAQGYITAPGGHRIGLCGEVMQQQGKTNGIRTVTSLNIRIARDFPGISGNLWLRRENILILGPPGSGKTTLLRDLIRQRSQEENISVVDERGEIFPAEAGYPAGPNTDVLTGCAKTSGVDLVLRTMSPDCIAVDEITASEDCDALLKAGWCGVCLLATAHASNVADLRTRPVYTPLLDRGLFDTAIVLHRNKTWHSERIRV